MDAKQYLTTKQVAEMLQISQCSVRRFTYAGLLPCTRLSYRALRFDPADVAAFVAARSGGHATA